MPSLKTPPLRSQQERRKNFQLALQILLPPYQHPSSYCKSNLVVCICKAIQMINLQRETNNIHLKFQPVQKAAKGYGCHGRHCRKSFCYRR
uniref:Uncharacterized protein n=1 Tax=Arundo donax TaxID=35708 RepID=A0A0A9H1T4_ARUDO